MIEKRNIIEKRLISLGKIMVVYFRFMENITMPVSNNSFCQNKGIYEGDPHRTQQAQVHAISSCFLN